ncbi:MAG TPA: trypsin-like serine protease [Fimbriimonadaceae bacterium]|nr:trypsin-like serine protease [Fimbriimonadaceae bacterium]
MIPKRHVLGVAVGLSLSAGTFALMPNSTSDTVWSWVGQAGGGGATAIRSRSVITAKHVPGLTYGVQGNIYTAVQRINHPTYDIAILNFAQDLPGWYEVGTEAPIDSTLTIVGWGHTGVVNAQGNGYDHQTSLGVRRAGRNKLHFKSVLQGYGPYLGTWLVENGDAIGAGGDSGGAFFIGNRLVGVTSFVGSTNWSLPNYGFASQNGGVPYMLTGAIDLTVPEIRTWIQAHVVPEPTSGLILTGLTAMVLRRRKVSR